MAFRITATPFFNEDERAANKSIIVRCSGSKTATLVLDLQMRFHPPKSTLIC
jgi:hypothetical protein